MDIYGFGKHYYGQIDENDKAHGFGRYINGDKQRVIEGQWISNTFTGYGRKILENGAMITGQWLNGNLQE